MNFLSEHPLQHDRANRRMGLVTSFQAFAPVASVVVLTGLVFAASSILTILDQKTCKIVSLDNVVQRC